MAFSYKSPIPVQHGQVTASQTGFPVLIDVTDNRFRTTGNGGHIQNANGYDIYFYSDSSLTTRIPAERELFNATTGHLIFWVKRDISSSADTDIYIGYGDSGISSDPNSDGTYGKTNVWDSNYKGVWHLGNNASLSLVDSTGISSDGTNNYVTSGTGPWGAAAGTFNGTYTYISIGSNTAFNTGDLTLSAWAKNADNYNLEHKYIVEIALLKAILRENYGSNVRANIYAGADCNGTTNTNDTNWHHYVGTLGSTTGKIYLDGSLENTVGGQTQVSGQSGVNFGRYGGGLYYFNGLIAEIRVSNIARSSTWIATEYANQNSPSTFCVLGTESAIGGGTQYTQSLSASWSQFAGSIPKKTAKVFNAT